MTSCEIGVVHTREEGMGQGDGDSDASAGPSAGSVVVRGKAGSMVGKLNQDRIESKKDVVSPIKQRAG
jgi:hypothetical protein